MSDAPVEDALPAEKLIEIDPPLLHKGGSFSELRLREPKVLEVYQAEQLMRGSVNVATLRQYNIALVSKVSGWPEAVVQQLNIRQLDEASRFIAAFINAGPETGTT